MLAKKKKKSHVLATGFVRRTYVVRALARLGAWARFAYSLQRMRSTQRSSPPTSPAETRVCSTAGSSMCLHALYPSVASPAPPVTPLTRIGMLHTARDVTMHAWHLHARFTHPPLFCDVFISRSRTRIHGPQLTLPYRSACCDHTLTVTHTPIPTINIVNR
jgi:hypothetical protein